MDAIKPSENAEMKLKPIVNPDYPLVIPLPKVALLPVSKFHIEWLPTGVRVCSTFWMPVRVSSGICHD